MKKYIFLSLVFAVLIIPNVAHCAVKGDIYTWQMKTYDWMVREFPDIVEKDMQPKEEIKGKLSPDELYHWQLKSYDGITQEFDMEPSR